MDAVNTSRAALTLQFLAWVEGGARTYADVMEAWRSTCPRLSIWEDALDDGLVRRENGASMKDSRVILTDRGRALLAQRRDQLNS